ncbi:MAG: flagellin [Pseudomonadota bacterium]
MYLSGIPTVLLHRNMQTYIAQTQSDMRDAQFETTTGIAANLPSHLNGDVGRMRQIEKQIADIDQRLLSIQGFVAEASMAQFSLEDARVAASDLIVDMKSAVGLDNEQLIKASYIDADIELRALFDRLNTPYAGRYIFSGAATDTPPLGDVETLLMDVQTIVAAGGGVEAALDTYFNTAAGGFQTNIYNGSTNPGPDREVGVGHRMGIEATALDQGIVDVIRGLAVMAVVDDANLTAGGVRDQIINNAADTLAEGVDEVLQLQTNLATLEAEAKDFEIRGLAQRRVFEDQLLALVGVDQTAAATRLNFLQTQLETAYVTTSLIQNLSLVNYLR